MLKIIICLLLVTGTFSLSDENNLKDIIKPDKVQNVDQDNIVDSNNNDVPDPKNLPNIENKPATPGPRTKLPPQLNKEQIDMLAAKVLRIHGVDPSSANDDNEKNIAELRKVVANVEKNLNEKLLLKAQLEQKQNNAVPEIKATASENIEIQEEVTNNNAGEASANNDGGESQGLNENTSETTTKPSETTNEEEYVAEDTTNEANTETEEEASIETIENETNTEENTEPQIPSDEKPETTVRVAEETIAERTETVVIEENTGEETNDEISEDVGPLITITETIAENISDSKNNDEVEEKIEQEGKVTGEEKEENDVNTEEGITSNEGEIAEDTLEEVSDSEQSDTIEKVNEKIPEDESNKETITQKEEEKISGSCELNKECDETSAKTSHAYTEEYNAPVTKEELENEIEDTHLQRIVKFFTSFLN